MAYKEIDWDVPIKMYIFESCWNCGKFIRTKNKQRLALFMHDHWGIEESRRCRPNKFGKLVQKYYLWKYRNV